MQIPQSLINSEYVFIWYYIEGFCNSYTGEHRVTLKSTIRVKVARKSGAIVDSSAAKTFYMVNAIGR